MSNAAADTPLRQAHGQSGARLRQARRRIAPALNMPTETFHVLLALLVGLGSGLFTMLFLLAIQWLQYLVFGGVRPVMGMEGGTLPFIYLFIPAAGGLGVGLLVHFAAREAAGHGIPEVMEAVALRGGIIRPRYIVVKTLASALCIGTGGSAGRVGPVVQIGAGVGSVLGQLFRLSEAMTRTLTACGAAAGIAAIFNAPVAGVFFAQELILGEYTAGTFSLIVMAAVVSSVVGQVCFGDKVTFQVPEYSLVSYHELVFYVILGMIAALAAVFFVRFFYTMHDAWSKVNFWPAYLNPAAGGLLLGLIGLFCPRILSIGDFPAMEAVLHNRLWWQMLLILALMKMFSTSLTLGSGGSGGVFAPSLYVGAMLGGAFGTLVHALAPESTALPGAYALVGMGAFFAGSAQAPMTAIVMLFELTHDYRIILPLMVSCVISSMIYARLSPGSIYTLKLQRRGINLQAGKDVNIMRSVTVAEAMSSPVETVTVNETIGEVIKQMQASRHNGFPVVDEEGGLVGMITLQDIRNTPLAHRLETLVKEVMSTDLLVAYPEETLDAVIGRFSYRDVGRLPVVDSRHPGRLVGMITRSDIIRAYNRAVIGAGLGSAPTRAGLGSS
ncbi:MAG TPA: CBS domain-containing protein [Firmicutes bacterium]|nr:CBS domain-containing protein [Bacillota bacterium]